MRHDRSLYRAVAQLHIDNIDQGFLPVLGRDFLALMYECIDLDAKAELLVVEEDDRIIGFVSAASGLGGIYRKMLRRWWRLTKALAPSLLHPARVKRILEVLRYSAVPAPKDLLPSMELLSLAVAPEWRGKGSAQSLYRALVTRLNERGVDAFRIVVGASLAPAHRFYQRMGAGRATEVEVHGGEISTIYVHRIIT